MGREYGESKFFFVFSPKFNLQWTLPKREQEQNTQVVSFAIHGTDILFVANKSEFPQPLHKAFMLRKICNICVTATCPQNVTTYKRVKGILKVANMTLVSQYCSYGLSHISHINRKLFYGIFFYAAIT
jgi:hypothetical protein